MSGGVYYPGGPGEHHEGLRRVDLSQVTPDMDDQVIQDNMPRIRASIAAGQAAVARGDVLVTMDDLLAERTTDSGIQPPLTEQEIIDDLRDPRA